MFRYSICRKVHQNTVHPKILKAPAMRSWRQAQFKYMLPYIYFFNCLVGCFSMVVWTPAVLSVVLCMCFVFFICTCSAQLSMFHMERRSRNTHIIIIIVIIIIVISHLFITTSPLTQKCGDMLGDHGSQYNNLIILEMHNDR